MELINVLKASLYKQLIEKKRYMFNTIANIGIFYLIFIIMFLGFKYLNKVNGSSPINYGNTLEGIIVSYYAWTMIMATYTYSSFNIMDDIKKGTLEQLMLSPIKYSKLIIIDNLINIAFFSLLSFIVLLLLMLTTGCWLNLNIISILILLFVGLFSILGIGLFLSGLAIKFKKIDSIVSAIQFVFLILVFIPTDKYQIMLLAPFSQANSMIKNILINNYNILSFGAKDYMLLILNSIVYFTIGVYVFNYFIKKSKKEGLLNHN